MSAPPARRRAAAIALAGVLVAALLLTLNARRDRSLERVQQRGELRIGIAIEPPYALLQPDGTPGGESPAAAMAVARALGLRATWVVTDFDRLIPELEAGRYDLIAAGLFVTPQRRQRVRFTRPTLQVRPGWLRHVGAAGRLGPYREAAQRRGLRLAVLRGSVEADLLATAAGPAGATLVLVPDARAGREAVATGRSDALALSMPTVATMAAGSSGRLVAEAADAPGEPPELAALALRRGEEQLAQAADEALGRYLRSPAHIALLRDLGLSEADLPMVADARE